nr:hypothetical protein [Halovulum marinum]
MIRLSRVGQRLPLLLVGRNVFLDIRGMQKMIVEGRKDLVLNLIQAELPGVAARPALARRRAGNPDRTTLPVMDRHAAAAAAAFQTA